MLHGSGNVNSSLKVTFSEDGMQLQKSVSELRLELRSLIVGVNDLHLNHKVIASNIQIHRDMDAELKAKKKHLVGELASTMSKLDEFIFILASLKAQIAATNVPPIFSSSLGNKQSGLDMAKKVTKETQVVAESMEEFKDLASNRMVEICKLLERKIENLKMLASLKNVFLDVKSISSSSDFLMLKGQLDKSKMNMDQCRILLKKLQVEEVNFFWHEKEVNIEVNMAVISKKIFEFSKSQIAKLEQELLTFVQDSSLMKTKLEETLRKYGRMKIISEFQEFVSLITMVMETMQSDLVELKDSFSGISSLRTQLQFSSALLRREAEKLQSLFDKSAGYLLEIKNLHLTIGDLGENEQDLNLFYEMYRRESTDSWEAKESREVEFKALAHVQSLKSSLDVHILESHLKAANEAESKTQERLATAEAEIADLRQNLELSVRQIVTSSEKLKSKDDVVEAYCSELESIGQAYEDPQIQNKNLLQELAQRDEDDIKIILEDVKVRQLYDVLHREIKNMNKKIQEAESLIHLYDQKGLWFDEELKVCSGQVAKLTDDVRQSSVSLYDAKKRLSDEYTESQELRHSLNEMQIQAEKIGFEVTELLIELAEERFSKWRINELSEPLLMKVFFLKLKAESSYIELERLREKISKYRDILNCPLCHERQKEVIITTCYHLFCNQCIQTIVGILRHRHKRLKCPLCSVGLRSDNLKRIYI